MRAQTVRPLLQFSLLAAAVVAIETAVLASRVAARHRHPIAFAVIADLCVGLPAAWWLLVVRAGAAKGRSVARIALLSVAACALLLARDLRLLLVPLELVLVGCLVASIRRALRARGSADVVDGIRAGLREGLGENPLARALAAEAAVLWYALFSWAVPPPSGFTAYRRSGSVAIHFAIGLAVVAEAIPFHFLLRPWGPVAAAIGLALHAYTLLWLVGDLQALRLRPIRVESGKLFLRIGLRWEAEIPLEEIAIVEGAGDGLRLGVLGTPNLILQLWREIELTGPFGLRRRARAIALQVDDPDGLRRALS